MPTASSLEASKARMKKTLISKSNLLFAFLYVGVCSIASAQVATGVSTSVNNKLNAFLYVVTGVAGS
jgi:hypothetical protein